MPNLLIPHISFHISVTGMAKSIYRCSLGVSLPISGRASITDYRGTSADGFFHFFLAVPVCAKPKGNHGVHPREVLDGNMRSYVLPMLEIGKL